MTASVPVTQIPPARSDSLARYALWTPRSAMEVWYVIGFAGLLFRFHGGRNGGVSRSVASGQWGAWGALVGGWWDEILFGKFMRGFEMEWSGSLDGAVE